MSFGPVTIATLDTMDIQAPGAPGLSALQISNHAGEFTLTPPTTDADGSPLSGLTFGQAVVIQADAATAELYRNDFDAALQFNGAQVFELDLVEGEPVAREVALMRELGLTPQAATPQPAQMTDEDQEDEDDVTEDVDARALA